MEATESNSKFDRVFTKAAPNRSQSPLRILTYTSLFPNSEQPNNGIFVYQRVAHLARCSGNELLVVAPVPYYPRWGPNCKRKVYSRVPETESIGALRVRHPRYLLVP